MSKPPIENTAYHEAGHAVACVMLDFPIESVTIEPDEESLGACVHPGVYRFEFTGKRERWRIARDCIKISYAGYEAEKIFDPDADEGFAGDDIENAFQTSREFAVLPRRCDYIGDENHERYLNGLRLEASKLVKGNWPTVQLVAEALLSRGKLSGVEVTGIVAT